MIGTARPMTHYDTYAEYRGYTTPTLAPKHVRRFEQEVWGPGAYHADMSVLEIGCGTGLVLANLAAKGVHNLVGIDQDPRLGDIVPEPLRSKFKAVDVWTYLEDLSPDLAAIDRIIMFDVLEHFAPADGQLLLDALRVRLAPDGQIHLKVPNAGSPWGQQFQYGDLTHRTAYTPESMRQQAIASGLRCRRIYPQKLGSPARQMWERLIHGFLDRTLTAPPEIWEGNFFALLEDAQQN